MGVQLTTKQRNAMRAIVAAEVARCGALAQAAGWPMPVLRPVAYRFAAKFAGLCTRYAGGDTLLTINHAFYDPAPGADNAGFLGTVAHEYAHAVCFARYYAEFPGQQMQLEVGGPWDAHGRNWQDTMALFGRPAEVRAREEEVTVAYQRASVPAFTCGCPDKVHYLTGTRAANWPRYGCSRCHKPLIPRV